MILFSEMSFELSVCTVSVMYWANRQKPRCSKVGLGE